MSIWLLCETETKNKNISLFFETHFLHQSISLVEDPMMRVALLFYQHLLDEVYQTNFVLAVRPLKFLEIKMIEFIHLS